MPHPNVQVMNKIAIELRLSTQHSRVMFET